MNKKTVYISAIVSLLSLFTACELTGPEPKQASGQGEKVRLRIQIVAEDAQSRTLLPSVALDDVQTWELWGAKTGSTETALTTFATDTTVDIEIETGDWDFTLKGYNHAPDFDDTHLILSGKLTAWTITPATSSLPFTVKPVTETGTGTLKITIDLPTGSDITTARVFEGATELQFPIDSDPFVLDIPHAAGSSLFRFELYNSADERYWTHSELVYVGANLTTEKTYTLALEDLNRTYTITYHSTEVSLASDEQMDSYQFTSAAKTLPTLDDLHYVFGGWYENAAYTGNAVTTIPQGSTGDKHFFAQWRNATLDESLTWLQTNAETGESYTITLSASEIIAPQTLSYSGKTVSITLVSDTTEQTVSLSSTGSLFTIESGVTLTLGNNVTLQGRNDNTDSVVKVNSGGTLGMASGSKITGNTTTIGGGGVSVYGGTFEMNGGEISGNNASGDGGGVSVDSGGTFTKSDGTIYGSNESAAALQNTAGSGNGHAVYVGSPAKKRNSTAGTAVSLNSATDPGWETTVQSVVIALEGNPTDPGIANLTLSKSDGGQINLPGGYTASKWYWDGVEVSSDATSYSWGANTKETGIHDLFVLVTDSNSKQLSGSCKVIINE